MKRLIPVLLLLIFFTSCFNQTPKGILPKDKMTAVLTDIHLVDGYTATSFGEASKMEGRILYKSVFSKYNTDSAGFVNSMKYYSGRPKELKEIFAAVTTNLTRIVNNEQKLAEQERRRNELITRRKEEKKKQEMLKQVLLKKEKATLDSIKKLPSKRRNELLELRNNKKMEKLREEFSKRQRVYRFWKFEELRPAVKKK